MMKKYSAYFTLDKVISISKFNLKVMKIDSYYHRLCNCLSSEKNPNFIELQDKRGNIKANKLAGTDKITFKIPFEEDNPGTYRILLSFRKTLPPG